MTKYAIDASAWIEYLEGTSLGKKVADILENDSNDSFTASVTFAEVTSKLLRNNKDSETAKKAMRTLSKIIPIDETLAEQTAISHAKIKKLDKTFGLADAFIIAMAESLNLTILTKDPHFKHAKKVIFLE